jgi:TonB C terminal
MPYTLSKKQKRLSMDNRRKKIIIISTSVLLHLLCVFAIFVLYHQPSGNLYADFDPSKAIDISETIFQNPESDSDSSSQAVQEQQPSSIFDDWGQFNPRASTLGDSIEMPEGPIGVEMPGEPETSDGSGQESESTDSSGDSSGASNSLEFSPQIQFEGGDSLVTSIGDTSTKTADTPIKKESKKSQARKALAGITRGYLQQLHEEGENLIKTLGGDPNKKPTAEQLKYERYLAKIQWCLQNAHSINQDKCQLQEPINSAMRIYFVVNREGQMTGFKIMQSSGKAYVDQYISSLFTYASSSFPPLPAYVKEDLLPLTYTVMVNWNTGSHTGFSRY